MEPLVCPPCVAPIPEEFVDWDATLARCPRCGLELVLAGELVPLHPVEGYPERLLAIREIARPDDVIVEIQRDPHLTRVRFGASFGRRRGSAVVDGRHISYRGRSGPPSSLAIERLTGFVPIQVAILRKHMERRESPSPLRKLVACVKALLLDGGTVALFELPRWDAALSVAFELNRALARHRSRTGPYR